MGQLSVRCSIGGVHTGLLLVVVLCEVSQIIAFLWKDPGAWEELIIIGAELGEFLEVLAQKGFSSDEIHGGKVIDLLIWLHLGQVLRVNSQVCEVHIPLAVKVFVSCDAPP